jgi:hypothetical protein
MVDGVLVCPFGVFPLELKDHRGPVELRLGGDRQSMFAGSSRRVETNPAHKMREYLREFGDRVELKTLPNQAKRCGIVLFTNPTVELTLYDGRKRVQPPVRDGEVIVCRPEHLAVSVLDWARRNFGNPPRPVLDRDGIERVAAELAGTRHDADERSRALVDFEVAPHAIPEESTTSCDVFPATYFGVTVWAKRYPHSILAVGPASTDQGVMDRELKVLLRLAHLRSPSIPLAYAERPDHGARWVFVEKGHPRTLAKWLQENPPRAARIDLLVQLAGLLRAIATAGSPVIVHRGLNPHNIRVKDDGTLQVVNFNFVYQSDMTTLMAAERQPLQEAFLAFETRESGRALTAAADIFGALMVAAHCLRPDLALPSHMQLRSMGRQTRFWETWCQDRGLPMQIDLWQRGLGFDAQARPDADELLTAMSQWS